MKFLALSLILIASVANAQSVIDGGVIRGQGFDNQNYAPNPFAEKNPLGWTTAGTTQTWTRDTSAGHKLNGISSFQNTVTSGTPNDGSIISGAITFPDNLVGRDCDASVLYHGATAGKWSFVVTDGSGVAASSVVALKNSGTTWAKAIINYPCTTGYKLKAYSTSTLAVGETFNVGNFSWGPPSAGTVAQAKFVGGWRKNLSSTNVTATSTQAWGTPSAAALASKTLYGDALAPSNDNDFAIRFASLPAGRCYVNVDAPMTCSSASGGAYPACQWTIFDGTNRYNASQINMSNAITGVVQGSTLANLSTWFDYTSPQSNITFSLQGYLLQGGGSAALQSNLSLSVLSMSVVCYPSQSETTVKPDQTPGTYSGSLVGTSWSVTSGSYVDFAAGSSISLTQTTAQNITCAAAGSSLPGITCTLPRLGNYEVCASGSLQHATTLDTGSIRIVDGGAVVINGGVTQSIGAGYNATFSICGQHAATTLSETFKLQGNTAGGTLSILAGNPITWTIKALDQGMAAPLVMGGLSTDLAGMGKHAWAKFGGATEGVSAGCASTPCTIYRQSGSIVSVTWVGSGQYTINFAAGTFSMPPVCTCGASSPGNFGGGQCSPDTGAPTTTTIPIVVRNPTGTVANAEVNLICSSPR